MHIAEHIRKNIHGLVLADEPLKDHTSFRIGGPADVWVEPADIQNLKSCLEICRDRRIPFFVLGGGTNILFSDEGFRGAVICLMSASLKKIHKQSNRVSSASSLSIAELLSFCLRHELGGLDFLAGVPGSVGGAVAMNAKGRDVDRGELWHYIRDHTDEVRLITHEGEIIIMSGQSWDRGRDIPAGIILESSFVLTKQDKDIIVRQRERYLDRKRREQHLDAPSAGCIFRNPASPERPAGRLIELCGLKGARQGGAMVSEKHANFIVNTGNALSKDVKELIGLVRENVRARFGEELTLEIKIV